jgi:hypothetical protein
MVNRILAGFLVMAAVACSSKDEKVSTDSSGNGVSKQSASCCLNYQFFDCAGDASAADKCFNSGNPGSCTRDSSKDESACGKKTQSVDGAPSIPDAVDDGGAYERPADFEAEGAPEFEAPAPEQAEAPAQ